MPAKQRADHDAVRAARDRLGEVARIFDAAVGDDRHVRRAARLGRLENGGELRHADAGHDPGGADRARPDADLDRVRPGVDQRLRALAGRHVAGDDRDLVGRALDAPHLLDDRLGMAVGGVDDEAVDPGRHQHLGALETLVADGGGGGDAEAPVGVLGGVRMGGRLLDVLDGDEADAAARFVDDDQLLDPVLVQEAARLVVADPLADRHHLAGHQLRHRLARIVGEAHVAVGEDADEPRRLAVGARARPPECRRSRRAA